VNIAGHLEKFQRFDAVRRRLDPSEDFELWFWMTLNAGTNALNAALHCIGATDGGEYFCTQAVDVYLEGDGHGAWKPVIRFGCDVVHVGMPEIEGPLPPALEGACRALGTLEEVRDPCVRGDQDITPELIAACDRAYRDCVALIGTVLPGPGWELP
jgi:hypothetical protein